MFEGFFAVFKVFLLLDPSSLSDNRLISLFKQITWKMIRFTSKSQNFASIVACADVE